jgi:hypothetical protein
VTAIAGVGLLHRVEDARKEVVAKEQAASRAAAAAIAAQAPKEDSTILSPASEPGLDDDPTAANLQAAKAPDRVPSQSSSGGMVPQNARLVRIAKLAVIDIGNAVEACAAAEPNHSYAGCGAGAIKVDADVRQLLDACGKEVGACVKVKAKSYVVTMHGTGTAGEVTFTQTGVGGATTRTCSAVGLVSASCVDGQW